MKSLLITMVVCFMIVPASAQLFCDVDGDGETIGGDIAMILYMLRFSPEPYSACGVDCDIDEDDESMTIADMTLALFTIFYPDQQPPDFQYNPSADTVKIGSAEGSPGDQLFLPIYLSTIDTLVAFEFLIMVDPQHLIIEDFVPNESLSFNCPHNSNLLHINFVSYLFPDDSAGYCPGDYYLGDLVVNIVQGVVEPVVTYVTFGTCPDDNFYTGLANMTFFVPVLVEGAVTVTPVGIEEDEPSLPMTVSINAYPNPFNMSVKIVVESPVRDVLSIYDILGREIYNTEINAGINNITWNSLDFDNNPVNAGIYFAKLRRSSSEVKKLLLVK